MRVVKVRLTKLDAVRGARPAGYVERILAAATRRDAAFVYLDAEIWNAIASEFSTTKHEPPSLPAFRTLVKNAAGAAREVLKQTMTGGTPYVDDETAAKREAACRSNVCGLFLDNPVPERVRCAGCGCFLDSHVVGKWKLRGMKCDRGYW